MLLQSGLLYAITIKIGEGLHIKYFWKCSLSWEWEKRNMQ